MQALHLHYIYMLNFWYGADKNGARTNFTCA